MRLTIAIVGAAALSTAALAQVGTDPVENKIPGNQAPAATRPPLDAAQPPSDLATPPSDDAAPADRADAPANVTPAPGDPRDATSPPPKAPR